MSLMRVDEEATGLDLMLLYATSDNLAGRPVYAQTAGCLLIPEAAEALALAARLAAIQGCRLRIFDAYRPSRVQHYFWGVVPDRRYVADPRVGSTHSRGIAVDLTLIGEDGEVLDMGTGFDAFDERSHMACTTISPEAQRNRYLLTGIMVQSGFAAQPYEWWHFNLPEPEQYPLIHDDPLGNAMLPDWLAAMTFETD
ncbi:D-alanyl-D-alanine dipeptidase [Kaustia mangrovi]|uniref:D-alanyl-D-alanine dipeptidase n=1 Tax=Kaustia mangrovi TaxID=2593653 RepID=A0A7S8C657_9HYPH|nr:D-alanyl-D-alanine dipeptidase [Kaustia mangrovi]QPC44102.1 D-alanyl-D-alanine dipeptidase [Kaustia mangrovi]